MFNDTWQRDSGRSFPDGPAPPYRGSIVHHHDHCTLRCQYCGPDSTAWALGEAVVAAIVAVGVALVWLIRHPAVAVALAAGAAVGWMLLTG